MDAQTVMRGQLQQAHEIIEQAVADLNQEHLHHRAPGGTVNSIAAIYAHTVMSEDGLVNGMLRKQPPVFATGDWQARVGFGMSETGMQSHDWADTVRMENLDAFREYAQQVYAATDEYLASLSDGDLDKMIETSFTGPMPLGSFLGSIIVWHAVGHGGEVCALKGCLGGQGLPF